MLVTGGDPMVMSTERLRGHLEPLLGVDSVRTIRIGTKSVAYWPQRFVTDPDADDVLRLFEQVVASGRQLAVMAHFSHPRELATDLARRALARIRATGAVVYCQAPLIAHVNDDDRVVERAVAGGTRGRGGALLPVRRAGHRAVRVLQGAAGPRRGDLHRGVPHAAGPGPHRTRPGHVGDARQGRGGRGRGDARRGVLPAPDAPGARHPTWSAGRSGPATRPTPPGSTTWNWTPPPPPTSPPPSAAPTRPAPPHPPTAHPAGRTVHRGTRHDRRHRGPALPEPGAQPTGGPAPGRGGVRWSISLSARPGCPYCRS